MTTLDDYKDDLIVKTIYGDVTIKYIAKQKDLFAAMNGEEKEIPPHYIATMPSNHPRFNGRNREGNSRRIAFVNLIAHIAECEAFDLCNELDIF